MVRPIFALRVQAEPGVHVIRSLRAWLKIGGRIFGLRCISIEEVTQENKMVDVRKYTTGFIRPEDLHDGSRQERIIHVYISDKHDCPVLEFESGDQLILWSGSNGGRAMARAYGPESDNWIGHLVELSLGSYVDKKTNETKEYVILETKSPRKGSDNGGAERVDPTKLPAPMSKSTLKDDLDDSIPFK